MSRSARVERKTSETQIAIEIDLDGTGQRRVSTPLPFLSHMLEQIGRHGAFDFTVEAQGDVDIDGHHTTEDIGIVFGQALLKALGDRKSITRYGSCTLPMDETLVRAALDLSGRPFFVWKVPLKKAKVGEFDVELTEVFFEAVARSGQMNLHMHLLEGSNLHHIIEASFKAFARALRQATNLDPRSSGVPSTKGMLDGS